MTQEDKMRAEFEAWACKKGTVQEPIDFIGGYKIWKAAHASIAKKLKSKHTPPPAANQELVVRREAELFELAINDSEFNNQLSDDFEPYDAWRRCVVLSLMRVFFPPPTTPTTQRKE